MCGFVGFTNHINDASIVVEKMMDRIAHRGPDQAGKYVDEKVAMGFRRLSIIDLSELGSQPMFNEDGSVAITFNGEIYNFQELREELIAAGHKFKSKADTEVLIHGYEQWDYETLLNRMNELGLKPEDYGFYLDLRKYGSARHAGFGLGFERCVMYLTGMANIRDVIPFPRTVNNCDL